MTKEPIFKLTSGPFKGMFFTQSGWDRFCSEEGGSYSFAFDDAELQQLCADAQGSFDKKNWEVYRESWVREPVERSNLTRNPVPPPPPWGNNFAAKDKPKKLKSFRLSQKTIEEIKTNAKLRKMSQTEYLEWLVENDFV